MWPFRKKEERAELTWEAMIESLVGQDTVTKEMALEIPSIYASVKIISETIASLPINLYKVSKNGDKERILDDERVALVNKDTKGNMTGTQLIRAMVSDYLLCTGSYVFVEKQGTRFKALHYVRNADVSIIHNDDPIFKSYNLLIRGSRYEPYEFIKLIRDTDDGFTGKSFVSQHQLMLAVAYNTLKFENKTVKKGGNKKGFFKAPKKLSDDAVAELKKAVRKLYSNDAENSAILNDGIDFKETSSTSVELQLNENKKTNSEELTMLFTLANKIVRGSASPQDIECFSKFCITPIITAIEDALDRDLLREKEKGVFSWKFDTTELNRGSFKDRIAAYREAVDGNLMQIDEVRQKEDLKPLGFNFVKLGLDSVLYDINTHTIYTPNTNQIQQMNDLKVDPEKGEENED